MQNQGNITQESLLLEYYKQNPNRDIRHPEIVDWVIEEYRNRTGKVFRDPDRAIRKLHQNGYLVKVAKGIYRYDPDMVKERDLEDFSPAVKEAIFKRDGYKCVVCRRGREEGEELHADHIKPKDKGGRPTLENGQTLCGQHNYLKKNYNQTEAGKRFIIRLYESAKNAGDKELVKFCTEVLEVYDRNNIDSHIEFKPYQRLL